MTGVRSANDSSKDIGPFPNGVTLTMVNYANFNQKCTNATVTQFIQYLGFLLLVQAVIIILIEKALIKLPGVSGNIERFYGTIVEDALFGKDPDAAEDVMDVKANTEAISRQRRRNEICMSLKRSSIIQKSYIYKNILQIILLLLFIFSNIFFGLEARASIGPSTCILDVLEIPNIGIQEAGHLFFHCEGKKVHFFLQILYIQIAVLVLVLFCCVSSLIWCTFFRSVSMLIRRIEKFQIDGDIEFEECAGEDFLFLFDKLAHTSGIESTLRVLTHADDMFKKICLPNLSSIDQIRVEEEKLKVLWEPARLEKWLEEHSHKGIEVDSYDVTIFPRESVNNSVTKLKEEKDKDGNYSAWFFDLQGGRTEYVVTVACVIGKSRMKGAQFVTTLLPYGPVKPRGGIVQTARTNDLEIAWVPPKGGFTKYVLCVDPNVASTTALSNITHSFLQDKFYLSKQVDSALSFDKVNLQDYTERELSNLLTETKIWGLSPGETYGIVLKTKTGGRYTKRPIYEIAMTQPKKVDSFTVDMVSTNSATLKWVAPEGHKRLRAYRIYINSSDDKIKRELAVKHKAEKAVNSFVVTDLTPATAFSVSIRSVCVFESLKTISEEEHLTFCSLPMQPTNISLETRATNSLTIKWEPPQHTHAAQKYKLVIMSPSIEYSAQYSITGDKNTFNFSKLPDIIGSGEETTPSLNSCSKTLLIIQV